jgi:hypothetical protein
MFFLSILAVILVACVVLWIVNTISFDGVLKKIFNTAIALAIMIWLLKSIDLL